MAKVLVADDSETILLLLRTRLEMAGYEVETAADGQEVIERLHREGEGDPPPDLLLLDAMMPRKSGIDALRELRAEGVDTPALIVSAHQDDADAPTDLEISGYVDQADRLRAAARRNSRAHFLAISRRISLPLSLVPSRNSTARSAWSAFSSTKEKRSSTRTEAIASSGTTAPSRSAQRRSSSVMPAALAAVDEELDVALGGLLRAAGAVVVAGLLASLRPLAARARRRARGAPRGSPTRRSRSSRRARCGRSPRAGPG